MKKNKNRKNVILALIIFVFLAILISQHTSSFREEDRNRSVLVNQVYSRVANISTHLDSFTYGLENETISIEDVLLELTVLSNNFARLDMIVSLHVLYFPSTGLSYRAFPSFDCVTHILVGYDGIMNTALNHIESSDMPLSENEFLFLRDLRDDMNRLLMELSCDNDQLNVREGLTISQLNTIFDDFFYKWQLHNENSPFMLLQVD